MPLRPFSDFRPDIAFDECRYAILEPIDGETGEMVPGGNYAFTEWYCDEPDCDCQRVMFVVLGDEHPRPLAHISFGFDRTSPAAGPFLDPLLPQSRYAEEFRDFVRERLCRDPEYVARCRRHYDMVKDCVRRGSVKGARVEIPSPVEAQARIALVKAQRKQRRKAEKNSERRRRRPR